MQKETRYIIIIAAVFILLAVIAFFIGKKAGYAIKSDNENTLIKVF
ncbi:MAG: hypothetical protein BWY27_01121 [Bacteroidetes bacterium ADurb.Bin234]|nr:MAG: hypothetical protein BWY27_01121 [Bacteroidetes bacterium ADurb.Bin234]